MAALVVVAMLSGCVTYGASKRTAKVGAGMVIAGLVVALAILAINEPGGGFPPLSPAERAGLSGFLIGVPGVVIGVGGLIGMSFHDEPPPPPPEPELEPPGPDEREQAFALTKTAARAARLGDCATAIKIEPQVRELDVMVHDAWFVRDPSIEACLDPAPVVPPAAPAASGIADPFESPTGEPSQPAPTVTPPEAAP